MSINKKFSRAERALQLAATMNTALCVLAKRAGGSVTVSARELQAHPATTYANLTLDAGALTVTVSEERPTVNTSFRWRLGRLAWAWYNNPAFKKVHCRRLFFKLWWLPKYQQSTTQPHAN